MQFFAIAAAFIAAVAAYDTGAADTCTVVTVTETVTLPYGMHTPSAPPSAAPTLPPYPTGEAPYPSVPAPSGTGVPSVPSYPAEVPSVPGTAPAGTAPLPSGTGGYIVPPPSFTGAASHVQVGGLVAGVGAFAAMFL